MKRFYIALVVAGVAAYGWRSMRRQCRPSRMTPAIPLCRTVRGEFALPGEDAVSELVRRAVAKWTFSDRLPILLAAGTSGLGRFARLALASGLSFLSELPHIDWKPPSFSAGVGLNVLQYVDALDGASGSARSNLVDITVPCMLTLALRDFFRGQYCPRKENGSGPKTFHA